MKKYIKSILFVFISIILFIIGFMLLKKSLVNYSQDIVNYKEEGLVDYKVYLNENSYFDEPYLPKNKAYITSLIDYIDIDFEYNLNLDSIRSGKYIYYIKGIMSANVSNTENDYWQKTYDLFKSEEIEYSSKSYIDISENIKIDYQTYNNLLLQFKEEYSVSFDGSFKVILYVENYINSDDGKQIKKVSTTGLSIPLTKATIEVPITINEINETNKVAGELVYDKGLTSILLKIASFICFAAGLIIIIRTTIKFIRNFEKLSEYNKELKNILKTYDGIIVNVNKLPDISNMDIIDVKTFNEMLDAHDAVRQPINFHETYSLSTFILINNSIAYRYKLKDGDSNEKSN